MNVLGRADIPLFVAFGAIGWRASFGLVAAAGVALAILTLVLLRGESAPIRTGTTQPDVGMLASLRVFLRDGVLQPGQSIVRKLEIKNRPANQPPVSYSLTLLSGQGNP